MEIQETYKVIDKIIKSFKKDRHEHNYLGLMESALALLEYTPTLINYSVEQEAEYRKFEARLADTTIQDDKGIKRNSSAYCETQSKATPFYKEWQRTKNFIELVYELVNIAKKLANSVDSDYISSLNK